MAKLRLLVLACLIISSYAQAPDDVVVLPALAAEALGIGEVATDAAVTGGAAAAGGGTATALGTAAAASGTAEVQDVVTERASQRVAVGVLKHASQQAAGYPILATLMNVALVLLVICVLFGICQAWQHGSRQDKAKMLGCNLSSPPCLEASASESGEE